MKNVVNTMAKLGLTLLFGLITQFSFADEKSENMVQPQNQPTQPTSVQTQQAPQIQTQTEQLPAKNTNPTATNPNIININLASAAEIQDKLVGIGAKKAQAIVDYREKNGKFIDIEQLIEVSGIGKATLEKNRNRIVLE